MRPTQNHQASTKGASEAIQKVSFIPKGYHSVTPYLCIQDAARALAFYKKAFGAKEIMRMPGPHGTISHAKIEINGHRISQADEYPDMDSQP